MTFWQMATEPGTVSSAIGAFVGGAIAAWFAVGARFRSFEATQASHGQRLDRHTDEIAAIAREVTEITKPGRVRA